ncbi:MAG TPA: methyltransferase [Longimicrobiaceae bacterium]|jgi:SAM-dependent methyltransferase
MPLNLQEEERRKLFETHEAPAPLLDLLGAYLFRMAGTAARRGVFELLREGPRTAAEAASLLGTDERGLGLLLGGLAAGGYLERDGERFANSAMTQKFLLSDSPGGGADMVTFYDTLLVQLWADLDASILGGEPPRDYFRWLGERPDVLRRFQRLLSGNARLIGERVVELAALPDTARSLLDLGGGHGIYAAAFCKRHPELRATLYDLPEALEAGREMLAGRGLEGRVEFRAGDLLRDDLGGGYDAVLLASVVHCLRPDDCARLLGRVREALKPGGVVIVSDQVPDRRPGDTVVRHAFLQTFSVSLFHLMGGQLYPADTIVRWLAGSGFAEPAVRPLPDTSFTLFVAARPED